MLNGLTSFFSTAERSPTIHAAGHDFDDHFHHGHGHDGHGHNHHDDHDHGYVHNHHHRNDHDHHETPGLIFEDSTSSTSSSTSRSGSSSSTSEKNFPTSRIDSNYLETTTLEQDDLLDLGLAGGKKGRQCLPFQIEFCRQLPYNFTTFPNAMGHRNVIEANRDIERFK